jgi:hypothetical protein
MLTRESDMSRKNGVLGALFAIAITASAGVQAAGSAVIDGGDGTQQQRINLEYSGDKLRMDMQGQQDGSMIVRDGHVYMVTRGMVLDLGSMVGMLGQQGMKAPSTAPTDIGRFLGLDSAGRSETIAGISGQVHVLRYEDEEGRASSEEVVLSKDSRARELTQALEIMATSFQKSLGTAAPAGEAKMRAALKGQGILRYGRNFRVVSFGAAPAASRFELPSAPQQMPSLGNLGSAPAEGTAPAAAAEGGGIGGKLGAIFGSKAQRQQDRAVQRSESEVDQATDKAVDSALDKAFDKIFGK